jgi:hypothetical protein
MIFRHENKFREHVLDVAEKAGYQTTHIESPVTSAGVPDLNLFHGVDVWLELKVWHPLRGVRMRPTQKLWHLRRHQANGLSWVLLHHEGKLSLIPGDIAARLKPKDPVWMLGYLEGVQSDLPKILRYCQREVMHRLTVAA